MTSRIALTITQKGLVLVAVPLLFELVFVAVLVFLLRQADADVERELKAKTIAQHVSLLNRRVFTAMTDVGVYNLTHSKEVKKKYERDVLVAKKVFQTIKDLVEDDKKKLEQLNEIEQTVNTIHVEMATKLKNYEKTAVPGMALSTDVVNWAHTSRALTQLSQKLGEFVEPELEAAKIGAVRRLKDRSYIEGVICIGIAANVLIAVLVALYFGRSISSRIGVLADNTFRFAKAQALNPPLRGDDELAHLDSVFHGVVADLNRIDRMKKEFLAVVSHDLRSPLMSVQGTLTLMANGILGELSQKAQLKIADAEEDIGRLINLINDLLDTELLESGEFALHLEELPINRVVERSIKSVQSLADKTQIKIAWSSEAATVLRIDEDRLVQVMVNLLSNAIKFSNSNSEILVAVQELETELEIRIRDCGRGIPLELQKQIFERYKQVERADSREKGGSGLGLFICKRIVDAHHGSLGVESSPGEGSTFWVRLPLAIRLASATTELVEPALNT